MNKLDLYECEICHNLVEVILPSNGILTCCGQPMKKLVPKTKEDAMLEKHVPVFIKKANDELEIRVGEFLHPMVKEHYITFIEAISADKTYSTLKYLEPNDEPNMIVKDNLEKLVAREFCNIHGLWKGVNE